jgi:hypothetical protein
MKGFIATIPKLWALYKEDQKKEAQKQSVLQNGPTEAFVKELMAQSEQGVEVSLHFPGGVTMVITRRAQSITTTSNGIQLREEYLSDGGR